MVKYKLTYFVIFVSIALLQSCRSQESFIDIKSFINKEDSKQMKSGFRGIGKMISIAQVKYKRFLLKNNGNTILDGYFSIERARDSIFFIPYSSYKNNCKKDKLTFFVRNERSSHYLGRSCENEYHYPTDVLVEYRNDTLINNINYHRFSHSIISVDDYNDDSDAIIATRSYLLNYKYGLILEKEEGGDFSPYWYNY